MAIIDPFSARFIAVVCRMPDEISDGARVCLSVSACMVEESQRLRWLLCKTNDGILPLAVKGLTDREYMEGRHYITFGMNPCREFTKPNSIRLFTHLE